jgi:hypothetical protein
LTLEPVAGFQHIFGSQVLNRNILRLRSSTKQKEYKEYKEYEEFKELLRRHLVFATRSFNERTRLIRGARPASWYSSYSLYSLYSLYSS